MDGDLFDKQLIFETVLFRAPLPLGTCNHPFKSRTRTIVITLTDEDRFVRRSVTRGRTVIGLQSVLPTLKVCLFLALACSCSAAFNSDRTIAQFAHTAWGAKDGAPSVVTALAQSADGYLWLGSPDGLYRFDGVVFERYQPQSGAPFPARRVSSLLALPNGDLWIGFRLGGVSLLRNGNVTNYTTRNGVPEGLVWGFAQDREGTLWVATNSALARLEGNRWKNVGKDWSFPGKSALTIFLDRQGILWVATENALVFLPPGARRFQPTGIQVGQVTKIVQAASGKLWMAETTRSVRPIPLSDKRRPSDDTEVLVGSQGILFDKDGALWITSLGDGLRRAPAPELLGGRIKEFSTAVESFTTRHGLSDDVVRAILQDREGNVWVGTNNGLDRFRKTNLVPVVLPFRPDYAVLAAGDAGDAWVRNLAFMVRVHGDHVDRGNPIPCETYLRTVTQPARFGGFARIPSIAMTRETTPGLRYRDPFRSLIMGRRWWQPKTAPVCSGWVPTEKVCSIGTREDGNDLKQRQNSQTCPPRQPLRIGWAAHGSDTKVAQSSSWTRERSIEFFPLVILRLGA
jgi:streptogramin lyase